MATVNINQANGLCDGALVEAHPSVRPKGAVTKIGSAWCRDSF